MSETSTVADPKLYGALGQAWRRDRRVGCVSSPGGRLDEVADAMDAARRAVVYPSCTGSENEAPANLPLLVGTPVKRAPRRGAPGSGAPGSSAPGSAPGSVPPAVCPRQDSNLRHRLRRARRRRLYPLADA
jgi:hypothetical protein